jgi:WD40 repeat protein
MHTGSSSNSQFQAFKPVYETGSSETCNSLQWDSHRDNYLLASLTGKSLKIFDIKVNMKAVSSVNTKYVYSFSAETAPNSSQYQACSYYENTVALWDLRMFDKPVDLINETDSIIKTQWCPTKPGKLAVSFFTNFVPALIFRKY